MSVISEAPHSDVLSRVPAQARDTVVAKVRLIARPRYLIDREPKPPLPKDRWMAAVELLEVTAGSLAPGSRMRVKYGVTGGKEAISPVTPRMIEREYFIVSYLDDDGERRLLDFAISSEGFDRWRDERSAYLGEQQEKAIRKNTP